MGKMTVDFSKKLGKIKPMHCVNNGPTVAKGGGTFPHYKELNIPFARNHDASFWTNYGANHTVDVGFIFTDFDKDENEAQNYDFYYTDRLISRTLEAGTRTYYRLGSRIENFGERKYNTYPPKDFLKWAKICEHIIRHCNDGWADGHDFGIEYWEIWNEPDLDDGKPAGTKPTWQGTKEEFFDFYETVSKHLKKCFPKLKIGGPGVAFDMQWADDFLSEMQKRKAPLDFFSWHRYDDCADMLSERAVFVRKLLDIHGFERTESHLNEWNYLEDWQDGTLHSRKNMMGLRGAVYDESVMLSCQSAPVDMMMYYDARPGAFNGLFEYMMQTPQKPYYAFKAFSELYSYKNQVYAGIDDRKLYYCAAKDGKREAILLSYYFQDETSPDRELEIELKNSENSVFRIRVLDEKHNLDKARKIKVQDGKIHIKMRVNTIAFIESV